MRYNFRHRILPLLHLIVIIVAYASPWFVPWPIVLTVFILYRMQFVLFGNCLLSASQFGNTGETFWYHYVRKIYPGVNRRQLDIFTDWILPIAAVIVAFVVQYK